MSHLDDNIVERRMLEQEGSPGDRHLAVYLVPEQSSQLCMNGKKVPQWGKEPQKTSLQESPWSSRDLVIVHALISQKGKPPQSCGTS